MYRFNAFQADFFNKSFNYKLFIPVINIINCKREGHIKAYLFSSSIFNKSLTAGNISVFENLNVI